MRSMVGSGIPCFDLGVSSRSGNEGPGTVPYKFPSCLLPDSLVLKSKPRGYSAFQSHCLSSSWPIPPFPSIPGALGLGLNFSSLGSPSAGLYC